MKRGLVLFVIGSMLVVILCGCKGGVIMLEDASFRELNTSGSDADTSENAERLSLTAEMAAGKYIVDSTCQAKWYTDIVDGQDLGFASAGAGYDNVLFNRSTAGIALQKYEISQGVPSGDVYVEDKGAEIDLYQQQPRAPDQTAAAKYF